MKGVIKENRLVSASWMRLFRALRLIHFKSLFGNAWCKFDSASQSLFGLVAKKMPRQALIRSWGMNCGALAKNQPRALISVIIEYP